jgi:hypothetical protein
MASFDLVFGNSFALLNIDSRQWRMSGTIDLPLPLLTKNLATVPFQSENLNRNGVAFI